MYGGLEVSEEVLGQFMCGSCGLPVPVGEVHCPVCGQIFAGTRTCHRCGAIVPVEVMICRNCGTYVGNNPQDVAWDERAPGYASNPEARAASSGAGWTGTEAPGAETQVFDPQVQSEKPIWARTARMDPYSIAAAGMAVFTICFYWVPNLGAVLALVGLVLAGIGFYRYFTTDYGHLWLLILSTVILVAGLMFGFAWSHKLDRPITMLMSMLM